MNDSSKASLYTIGSFAVPFAVARFAMHKSLLFSFIAGAAGVSAMLIYLKHELDTLEKAAAK